VTVPASGELDLDRQREPAERFRGEAGCPGRGEHVPAELVLARVGGLVEQLLEERRVVLARAREQRERRAARLGVGQERLELREPRSLLEREQGVEHDERRAAPLENVLDLHGLRKCRREVRQRFALEVLARVPRAPGDLRGLARLEHQHRVAEARPRVLTARLLRARAARGERGQHEGDPEWEHRGGGKGSDPFLPALPPGAAPILDHANLDPRGAVAARGVRSGAAAMAAAHAGAAQPQAAPPSPTTRSEAASSCSAGGGSIAPR
jgi:hypothetical protein